MNNKNSNFVPLKHVKVEQNTNDFDNNIQYFIEDQKKFVPKNAIKCKNKCFDIVDKWIARVVVKVPTGNNWHNIVAREIAILKVRYPFLTEQQLKGKALMKFGIPSMCGNVVRTGTGKVTGAIAKELSRKRDKNTRIPSAFKVLKNFLPSINKFEAKSETNIWPQEYPRIPTLYNRETTAFTTKMIQPEKFKFEKMKTNYSAPPKIQNIVMNPMSRPIRLSPKINNTISTSEQISCAMLTPKKKQLLQPQRKILLSQFNDTHDSKMFNDKDEIEQMRMKFKYEMELPENIECIRTIGNCSNGKINNNIQNEICNKEQPKRKMLTYSELSEDSIDVLNHIQSISKELQKNDRNNYEEQMKIRIAKNPKTIVEKMEIDSDIEEFELNNSNCWDRKQLLAKSHGKKYKSENVIARNEDKSSMLNYSPLSPTALNRCHGVKRHQYNSVDILSSPRKISRRHFQGIPFDYFSCDQIHDFYDSQTISNKSIDEKSTQQSKDKCTLLLNDNRVNSSFEPTPLNEELSSIEEINNNFGIPMLQPYAKSSYFDCSSMPNTQFPSLSTSRCDSTLNPWETINNEDFGCETIGTTQESRTTCTLTPNIDEIFLEIDVPTESFSETILTQTSVDLLERENAPSSFHFDIHSNIQSQSHRPNDCTQQYMKYEKEKSFMLSDFCCEYDRGWTRLIRKKRHFMNKKRTSTMDYSNVTMKIIKISIEKAIEILD